MSRLRLCGLLVAVTLYGADSDIWKVAPPAPASWQRDRLEDLSHRRQAVMERIGEHALLLLYAAEPRNYAGDVDWPYRQENNFYYLTGIAQAGLSLALVPGGDGAHEILFLPPPDPAHETWTGHMMTTDEARAISGIREIRDAASLDGFVAEAFPRARSILNGASASHGTPSLPPLSKLLMLLPERPDPEYTREREFASRLGSVGPGIAIEDATPIFAGLRSLKSPREIDLIRHAIDITVEAFQRVFAEAVPGAWEYEIQAQFEFTFLRRNGHWGYPSIVGAGANATTLHYESNRARMADGDLLLMDDGAEFDGYSADVTRTIPVNGRFTREQADIYRLVWEARQAAIRMARPGHASYGAADSMQTAAGKVLAAGLVKLGLMTDAASLSQLRLWFPHGISHGVGLNVHDPGGRNLREGMIVTVEPGLYFRPDALDNLPKTPENEMFAAAVRPAFERYKGIGVRIEDDVLITAGEPKVLSSAIPSRLEEVEETLARLRKALRHSPLP
jgi:Xaa-Pro aminopeptidase